jgi:hypothetical protein
MKTTNVFSAEDFDDLSIFVEKVLLNQTMPKDEKKRISDLFKKAKTTREEIAKISTAIEKDIDTIRSLKFTASTGNLASQGLAVAKEQIRDLNTKISKAEKERKKVRNRFLLYTFGLEEEVAKFR